MRAVLLLLVLAACNPDAAPCARLVERCPVDSNAQACRDVLGELRRAGRADEAEKRGACIMQADGCTAAAVCLQPEARTGWSFYLPQR